MISRYRDPPECPIGHPNRLVPVQFAVLWGMLHACAAAGDEESWEPPPDVRRIGSPLLSGELLPAEEPLHAPEQTLASLLQQCLRQDGHARHTVNGEST